MNVIKRDGSRVEYNPTKIRIAISKAIKEVYGTIPDDSLNKALDKYTQAVRRKLSNLTTLDIELIQDVVEDVLMMYDTAVAKAYIRYRYKRELKRKGNTTDDVIAELIEGRSKYWNEENSNKNSQIANVQRDYLAGITSTDITRRFLLPEDVVKAHDDGLIHFHDADYFIQRISNCCLINLGDMLQNGTVINKVKIEKPHRLLTATTITTQIITAVASSQYGGTSIDLSHLAPFVRDSYERYKKKYKDRGFSGKDIEAYTMQDLSKEIEDAVQTFNYQINSMQTTNGQAPFITVFMNINSNPEYEYETVLLIEEFLKQRIQGLKNEKGAYITQAFPKLIYVLDENNAVPGSDYWWLTELSAVCTAKRMCPDYISAKKMREDYEGNVFSCMGCRSFLAPWKDENGQYKFEGRFNQGVVTINLPHVALSSKGDIEKFKEILDERLEICHKALLCRHKRLLGTKSDIAPIMWQYGAIARLEKGQPIDELLFNGYSSISLGYAGIYECVKYMTGESHTSEKGKKFALEIMQRLNEKCEEWKAKDNLGYAVYGTPLESVTYKFATKLKEQFGVIDEITDHNYVTNSYHINVREKISPFEKLKLEADFQTLSKGGCVSYIEASDMTDNIPALLSVIRYIYNTIKYAEINTKSDYCQCCGYDKEMKIIDEDGELIWECPNCKNRDKNKLNVARRSCGYIGSNFWNAGRTEEIKDRFVHLDNIEE